MTDVPGIIEHFPYVGLFLLLILGGIGLLFSYRPNGTK